MAHTTDRETLARECEVEFMKATGPGGQHRNKRETGVRLRHLPTGIVVIATERRSQVRNLEVAYERLAARLVALDDVPEERVPTKVPRAARRRRLEDKRHASERKAGRRRPPPSDT